MSPLIPAGTPKPVGSEADLSSEQRSALELVRERRTLSDRQRKLYIKKWNEYNGLHRNHRKYQQAMGDASSEPDRDEIIREARRDFGAELFIPLIFTTVETIVPRIILNNPKMIPKPVSEDIPPERIVAVKNLYEARQSEIDYALRLLPTARSGIKYGLGVQKTVDENRTRSRVVYETGVYGQRVERQVSEDVGGPISDNLPVRDFYWDPVAKNIETSRYAIARYWRDYDYIRKRVETGDWEPLDLAKVEGMGGSGDLSQQIAEKAEAQGMVGMDTNLGKLHEVLEYHDGNRVITVLDGSLVVQDKPSPFSHRELPFQIYRPTVQEEEAEFVGIGEIEPIVHLQYELNTLRSQRRDNATMVLQKAFVYAEGMVEPENLVIGPGVGIPVYGNPSDVIVPLNFGDIPASGYQEAQELKQDAESAVGISDALAGGGATSETATGEQIVQHAAGVRVTMKTKLLVSQVVKPAARQWLDIFRGRAQAKPLQVAMPTPDGYSFDQVSASELDAIDNVLPEAESTAPENKAEKENKALALLNQVGQHPVVDPRKAMIWFLRQMDIPDAEDWVVPEATQMNPQVAQMVGMAIRETLEQSGMDPEQASQLALQALEMAMSVSGVSAPGGATPVGTPSIAGGTPPAQNGAGAPAPQPAEAP